MVSKAGVEGATDKALMSQLSFYPQALGMAAAVLAVVGVMPGMPLMVFGPLAGAFAATALSTPIKRKDVRTAQAAADIAGPDTGPKEEPISTALAMDLLRVELGYGLLTLINDVQGHKITDQIKALRRQLAQEMGFVHAGGAHPGQHDAWRQRISHPHQGIRFRQGRTLPRLLPDHGSQGPAHRPARHPHHRAGLRPARHLGLGRAPGRGFVPRLHRGRSRHGADHASYRSAQEPHGRTAVLRRNQEAAG